MNFDSAINAHAQWKTKFRTAIAAETAVDLATIGKDNCCDLGKWLYGEGEKLYGSRPEYIALKEKHRIFHAEAAKIAVLINDKRYKEAEAAMGSNLPYGNASLSVVSAISAIKKIL